MSPNADFLLQRALDGIGVAIRSLPPSQALTELLAAQGNLVALAHAWKLEEALSGQERPSTLRLVKCGTREDT